MKEVGTEVETEEGCNGFIAESLSSRVLRKRSARYLGESLRPANLFNAFPALKHSYKVCPFATNHLYRMS
jgi:hypothetical protein